MTTDTWLMVSIFANVYLAVAVIIAAFWEDTNDEDLRQIVPATWLFWAVIILLLMLCVGGWRFLRDNWIKILKAIGIALIIFILTYISNEDFKDNVRDQEHYCKMVEQGRWPPFKGNDFCSK